MKRIILALVLGTGLTACSSSEEKEAQEPPCHQVSQMDSLDNLQAKVNSIRNTELRNQAQLELQTAYRYIGLSHQRVDGLIQMDRGNCRYP